MNKKTKDVLKYLVWTAIAVLLLYFSFRNVDWTNFGDALRNCRWEWVIFSMVLGVVVLFVRGLRWQMLLRPIDPSTQVVTTFNAMNICMIVNLVLPRVGEVVRAGYITRHSAKGPDGKKLASVDKVLGTVVIDRLWDAVSLVIVLMVMLLFMWGKFGAFFTQNIFSGLTSRTSVIWILVAIVLGLILFIYLCYRWREKGQIWGKVWGFIAGIGEGLKSCLHMRHGWLFVLYTAIIWGLYWLMSAGIMWAVQGIDPATMSPEMSGACQTARTLGMVDALFLMFAGALSSVVPVPGGFGAFHVVVAGALTSIYGIPFEFGLIFATLSHESQVISDAFAGICSYIWESFRKPADN